LGGLNRIVLLEIMLLCSTLYELRRGMMGLWLHCKLRVLLDHFTLLGLMAALMAMPTSVVSAAAACSHIPISLSNDSDSDQSTKQLMASGGADTELCDPLLHSSSDYRDEQKPIIAPQQPAKPRPIIPIQNSDAGIADGNGNRSAMSLQQVVEFGLRNNVQYREQLSRLPVLDLDVQAASDPFSVKSNISSSSSQRVGSELGQNYQVNLSKKFFPGTNIGLGFGTARFGGQSLSEATLSLRQPLLRGQGGLVNTIGIEEAEKNRLRQRNLIVHQQQQLILDIISAYYRSLLQQKSIRIHQATIEQSQNMLDASNAKFKFGMVSRMDVFRAELQLLEAQESFETAQGGHEKSLDELKLMIGAKLDDALLLSDSIRFQQVNLATEHILVEQALASRHELANLNIDRQMLVKKISVAKNNMLPQLDLTLQVSQSGTANSFAKSTRLKDTQVGFGISGSPDFSMAAEEAQYKRQLLAHDNAGRQYRQMQERIRSAVKERMRQVRQGEKRISLRQRKVEAAEKQKQYALVRYQKGLVDNSTLVDAEKGMVAAKIGYLQAIVDYNISLYALYKETSQLDAKLLNMIEKSQ